uniref:Uncharacterized protein n=1 Tax=Romanomermis culicivorax TaxID=13658 RepID=A0A915IET8_ROMCU
MIKWHRSQKIKLKDGINAASRLQYCLWMKIMIKAELISRPAMANISYSELMKNCLREALLRSVPLRSAPPPAAVDAYLLVGAVPPTGYVGVDFLSGPHKRHQNFVSTKRPRFSIFHRKYSLYNVSLLSNLIKYLAKRAGDSKSSTCMKESGGATRR